MKEVKKGDLVIMHSCMEAKEHKGKIWRCETNEEKGKVFLFSFSGKFNTKYLQKVDEVSLIYHYFYSLKAAPNSKKVEDIAAALDDLCSEYYSGKIKAGTYSKKLRLFISENLKTTS